MLTPDGTLFLLDYQRSYRSDDHGRTWQALPVQETAIQDWVVAADFATSGQIYGIQGYEATTIMRSDNGGQSWPPPTPVSRLSGASTTAR